MNIFSNLDNKFRLLDYSISHGQMVIRSMQNKTRDYNIDIYFRGVSFLIIPEVFEGLGISLCELISEKTPLIEKYGLIDDSNYKIFSLNSSTKNNYYVNAMGLSVYHNKCDILETSIGRYDWGDLDERVFFFK